VAYRTVAAACEHVELIKGSRFRARVVPLADPLAVPGWVAQMHAAEPDAHHVAYAWRFGAAMRFSDDGEPGGTAGRPMLEVLLQRDLDRVLVLVARVFGATDDRQII
jgi:putative IMPACT (imprinted ancient) family translation regulator